MRARRTHILNSGAYVFTDKLAKLSERTGVDKAYILVVAIALMIITLYLIGGASLFT
jgi:hypothetical protein